MRVLITGAAGMLGQDVQRAARAAGHEVVGCSREELDIAAADAVAVARGGHAPEVVVNCAAYTKVDQAEDEPAAAHRVNAEGPAVLARACGAVGAWLVHVSTDYVFAGDRAQPYVESDPVGPRSVYGQSKLAGERAVRAALPDTHTIVRTAWLFGTGGPCFPGTILRAAATRPVLRVVDDQIGSPTFTGHLAPALVDLAQRRDIVGVAHVAGAGACSWCEFAAAIVAAAGDAVSATVAPCTTAEYPTRAPRPAFSVLRSERAGVPVLADWRSGLADYMAARATPEGQRA
ncbi:MAG TPA: dTDP-4-dehydrorhamnose reductase [Solirubrobacteraceae bacterium]|nr:dTDP-4-dehydrorhamnose reductase [Solirubrobacteraceae bacterium]